MQPDESLPNWWKWSMCRAWPTSEHLWIFLLGNSSSALVFGETVARAGLPILIVRQLNETMRNVRTTAV